MGKWASFLEYLDTKEIQKIQEKKQKQEELLDALRNAPTQEERNIIIESFNSSELDNTKKNKKREKQTTTYQDEQEEIYRIRRQKAWKALKFLWLLWIEIVKVPFRLLAHIIWLSFSWSDDEEYNDEEYDCEKKVLDSIKKSPVSDETKEEARSLFNCIKDKWPDNCSLNKASEEARKTLVDAFDSCKLK